MGTMPADLLRNRTRRALNLIKKHQFKTLLEASKELTLTHVSSGAFRRAYRIKGTTLLIKFPYDDGECHTRAEVRKIRILSQYKSLRKNLPPVYYFNSRDGVMVTKFYPKRLREQLENAKNLVITRLVKELTGITLEDICGDNCKVDAAGRLIFVDLGY